MMHFDDESRKRVRLIGLIVAGVVLASFMTGLMGMVLSRENREYFITRLKNIKKVPYLRFDREKR
ncbi:hypothetical protein Thal_1570 [Thermocrinis albus DSM 14484]|uniref:Uncharacterized protein n=1 Tax=Thermocrinis albus (strain DSM 14484 / JCM 11386 / HI 11/12) TaxID=638303 RepID=D3SN69_THEAH|nr:hypothetical protein [Thermocrinis albus]ADC90199.1 hypothetical protein Thal_1570 [Thermocrinis albus DSM 14484]